MKETKTIATTTVLSAVANTVLNAILIPIMGALGAAIATAVAYLVMWVARIVMSRKYIKFRVSWIRDCAAYGVLMLQVILEHMNGHVYAGQAVCLLGVIVINANQVILLIKKLRKYVGG